MHHKPFLLFAGIFIVLFCHFNAASAQNLPGKRDSIKSVILNQERFIQVVLPPNYKPGSTDKYDVIYVTDGDDNTKTMADVQQFVSREGFMPQVILVGILNIDRNKDLTPTHARDFQTSGGAAQFLAFIKNELVPYIDRTYPSDGENILFGHSFGGLFVTYALLNEPQLFNSYIAADPSYWWDNGYMISVAATRLYTLANSGKTIFISGREGDAMRDMAITPMDTVLTKYHINGLRWKIAPYPNETHGSVRLKTMYDGLRFIYDGYHQQAPEFHPMNGMVLKDKPIRIWDLDDTTKVHYTTDGTTPTLASPRIGKVIAMPGPGILTAKIFAANEKYDRTTTGVFKTGEAPAPLKKAGRFKAGGWHYAYFEGAWDKLPDFTKLKPVKEGLADSSFHFDQLPAKTNFGLVFSGLIEVKEDGYYIFGLASDDGSRFYLGGQLLLDDDGLHDNNANKSYILPLKTGFYPIRLEYFQKDGGSSLQLVYLTPGMLDVPHPKPVKIPWSLQYGRP